MWTFWIILFGAILSSVNAGQSRASCAEVRRAFTSKGIGAMKLVPFRAITTNKLEICSTEMPTCCNRKMEKKYQIAAQKSLAETLQENFNHLRGKFSKFLDDFRDDYQELLMKSKEAILTKLNSTFPNLDELGLLQTVDDVFDDLALPPNNKVNVMANLKASLEKLFLHLFVSTFQKQSEIQSSTEEIKCIENQIEEMSYHNTILELIQRIATFRNLTTHFLEAVYFGVETLKTPAKFFISKQCEKSLVKMQYCSHCYGLTLIRPCKNYCRNVMRGCLVGLSEVDRHWRYYVKGLNDVIDSMSKEEADPQTALDDVTSHINIFADLILDNEITNEITQACIDSASRPKRSLDDVKDDVKEKPRHQRRHQRSRDRRNRNADLETELEMDEMSPRRIIPPPHEMLLWEPSLARKSEKRQTGKRRRNENQIVEEFEPEGALLQPETTKLNLKSKMRRFVAHLDLSSHYFSTLPDDICNSQYESAFSVTTQGSCWEGKSITNNYTVPLIRSGLQSQESNPEVVVTGFGPKATEVSQKLRRMAKDLMLRAGKTQLPADLLNDSDDVITFDQSQAPCGDDEDNCAGSGSGEEFLDDRPQNKGEKRIHKNRNKHHNNRRKHGRKNKDFDETLTIMAEVNGKISNIVQAEDKTISPPPQGGNNESKTKDYHNSSNRFLAWKTLIWLLIIFHKLVT